MTNQGETSGPSLFQARSTRHNSDHNHNHNHNRNHLHLHQHRRLQHTSGADTTPPHIRSPPNEKLHGRQEVVVVQTVSIVHYIDATGSVTSVETLRSDPNPDPVPPTSLDLPALVTAGLTALGDALPSVSLSGLLPDPSDGPPSTTTASAQSEETASSSSSSASTETLTTLFEFYTNHVFFSFHVRFYYHFDPEQQLPTPEPPSGLAPETRNAVVGGVVGSVAGIALIAFVFLYLLKWRRQRGRGIMLLGDGDSSARGRGLSSGGPASPGGGRGMTERTGAFAIPSALAKLSGRQAIEAPPAEPPSQEKGFYRVSGKKLISVLESGGDGYSDPHDSIGSGSSYYRDSQAFLDSSNLQPLQLGSPMRPVSGVPIFRDGPQRTALHEEGPSPSDQRRSAFPTTLPVPVSRPLASRNGSYGSGSRFTEEDA
ncbi:hypothetical protein NEMBOFW57_005334 [Staphylotrichum longicolle]|uniref:Uncharacterized protein n=1 Tax=Staphylotrichum longicolle TaxID=669026 RepID=A0AAD4EWS1_9PEZI|nr:hypothetical protein NEMBOFW57_005334 [Staphylotrichum longicolle]